MKTKRTKKTKQKKKKKKKKKKNTYCMKHTNCMKLSILYYQESFESVLQHYENTLIQIYRKFHLEKNLKNFR